MRNQLILDRLDQLISEGDLQFSEFMRANTGTVRDPVRLTPWTTSALNLLDKLSVSTNRFVREFETWVHFHPDVKGDMNIGAALGVLKSAREEYTLGLAVEYHLSVSAAVFEGLLDEANYLAEKGYLRASAVLMLIGAALEEGLKNRARRFRLKSLPKTLSSP